MLLEIGDTYRQSFSFSQEDVIKFAEVTGDKNPLHPMLNLRLPRVSSVRLYMDI